MKVFANFNDTLQAYPKLVFFSVTTHGGSRDSDHRGETDIMLAAGHQLNLKEL